MSVSVTCTNLNMVKFNLKPKIKILKLDQRNIFSEWDFLFSKIKK
jgi:hypothetical protein